MVKKFCSIIWVVLILLTLLPISAIAEENAPFRYNTVYTASVTLTADANHEFAPSPTATVDSEAATVTRVDDTEITVKYTFAPTGKIAAPTAVLVQANAVSIANSGEATELSLNVSGLLDGYNEVTWRVTETSDDDSILTLPEQASGALSNDGALSLDSFTVAPNAAGEDAKRAAVTIAFIGNASGDYASVPAPITVTFQLAQGEPVAAPVGVLNFTNEQVTGLTAALADNGARYRCKVTDSASDKATFSNAATLRVNAVPTVSITTAPASGQLKLGESIVLTAYITGGTAPFSYAWSTGGASVGTTASITVSPTASTTYTVTVTDSMGVTATASVTATITHTITATAGRGGSITPSGAVSVADGDSQSFVITPASGYAISDVLVNGVSVGRVNAYAFSDVKDDQTIEACFSWDDPTDPIVPPDPDPMITPNPIITLAPAITLDPAQTSSPATTQRPVESPPRNGTVGFSPNKRPCQRSTGGYCRAGHG